MWPESEGRCTATVVGRSWSGGIYRARRWVGGMLEEATPVAAAADEIEWISKRRARRRSYAQQPPPPIQKRRRRRRAHLTPASSAAAASAATEKYHRGFLPLPTTRPPMTTRIPGYLKERTGPNGLVGVGTPTGIHRIIHLYNILL